MCGVRDELVEWTRDMAEQTRDRSETLEQRLKSWQVRKKSKKKFEILKTGLTGVPGS